MNQNITMSEEESRLAGLAQTLFLLNISFLPVVSFIILITLYLKKQPFENLTVRLHFRQAILANILAGILLLAISGIILFINDFNSPYTWAILITYFTCVHSALILYGVYALMKTFSQQAYVYPLIGKYWQ